MKKRVQRIIILNVIMIFVCIFFFVYTSLAGKLGVGTCLFFRLFHLYCPGCGGTRALKSLLRLDIISSFKYNACLLIGVILYIYYNVKYLIAILKKDEEYFEKERYRLMGVYAIFILLYFVIRNVLLIFFKIDFIGDVIV